MPSASSMSSIWNYYYGLIPTCKYTLFVGRILFFWSASSSASISFPFNASTKAHAASFVDFGAPSSVLTYTPVTCFR
jgi:hypothetical protein